MATDADLNPGPETHLSGSSLLLVGPPGTGKTTSLVTAIKAGLEVFVLITDPGGEEALLDAVTLLDADINKLHYHYVAAASQSWATFTTMGKLMNTLSYTGLADIKSGVNKADHQQFLELIDVCADFKCDRTGESYGAVDSWGPDRLFAVDSLSGVNTMVMDLMIGAKPTAHQGEWGAAMNAEERLVKKWCSDLKCFFILTAHITRSMDETIGRPIISVGALGNKLAPKLPKDFSDVVLSVREGTTFTWSTTAANIDLKARTLPLSDKLLPDFGQMVESWRKRNKLAVSQ